MVFDLKFNNNSHVIDFNKSKQELMIGCSIIDTYNHRFNITTPFKYDKETNSRRQAIRDKDFYLNAHIRVYFNLTTDDLLILNPKFLYTLTDWRNSAIKDGQEYEDKLIKKESQAVLVAKQILIENGYTVERR